MHSINNRDKLDPWRVISACVLNQSNYEIPKILDRAGLAVDWNLDDRQNYSDKTRKAAYRPRINLAYEALSTEDQLRAAYIVASELADREQTAALNTNLEAIGWTVEGNRLVPTNREVSELFFPAKTHHDAYVEIRNIFKKATKSITVIDPYLDEVIFRVLSTVIGSVNSIKLLTSNKHPPDFTVEASKFLTQHNDVSLEVRCTRAFHDRFLVLDDTQCWHIGASIKDAGGKAFMISCLEDEKNRIAFMTQFLDAWANASPLNI